MIKRAYKYRFYPTDEQAQLLAQTFGCVRAVYNNILKYRTDAYYNDQEKISYVGASAELTRLKNREGYEWLNDVSSVPLQQCLRHQQAAFINFFAGRARYPAFKKRKNKQSITLASTAFRYKDGLLYMAKSKEPLDIKLSRDFPGTPSTITISKDCAGRYFVSCLCEFDPKPLPITPKTVGIDLGLTHLAIEDNGIKHKNHKYTRKYEKKLAKAQRVLSKKKLGSANRARARIKVARVHAKISDSRLDNLHKLSSKLINDNQVVCVESLKVKNMIRNPKLSRHIADAGWGEFVSQLGYKAKWYGRDLVKIDQWFPSSKRCSTKDCGYIAESLPLDVRSWECPSCCSEHDRDINAAKNIKAVGHTVLALGESVSLA